MRLYRALLHLYPAGFRAEYAEDLCALFALRRAQVSNPFAVARALARGHRRHLLQRRPRPLGHPAPRSRLVRAQPPPLTRVRAHRHRRLRARHRRHHRRLHARRSRPPPPAALRRFRPPGQDLGRLLRRRLSPFRSLSRELPRLEAPFPLLRRRRSMVGSHRQSFPGGQSRAARRRRNHRGPAAHAGHTTRARTRLHPG